QGQQIVSAFGAGAVLPIQGQLGCQLEDQTGATIATTQTAVDAGIRGQVVTLDMHLITSNTGNQRQALGELRAVLGKQRKLPGQIALARPVTQRIVALILTTTGSA